MLIAKLVAAVSSGCVEVFFMIRPECENCDAEYALSVLFACIGSGFYNSLW
jgi:hypothetical protein